MASEDHDESSLTMMDILEEQEALQEDAEAVLGSADDDKCTYEKGYMGRQAVYACLTCSPVGGVGGRAGVCLACSLHCHNTHNLVELYTKRNFRCDCGNSKIVMTPCKLEPIKDVINSQNKYNQNFDGLYCICHRPYPDPEQTEEQEDEMIQCCSCEDWYHSKHLGLSSVPTGDQFAEMVCFGCVQKLPFLANYAALAVTVVKKSELDTSVDIESTVSDVQSAVLPDAAAAAAATTTSTSATSISATTTTSEHIDGVNKGHQEEGKEDKKKETEKSADDKTKGEQSKTACCSGQFKSDIVDGAALFFPEDWRDKLCTCDGCKSEYSRLTASYLPSTEDTISHYEYQARKRLAAAGTTRQLSVERELDALNSVDRVTRTEMVTEYNTLSTELREFLRTFASSGKVVKDDDIKEFFAGLHARKKQKGTDGMPPNVCKW